MEDRRLFTGSTLFSKVSMPLRLPGEFLLVAPREPQIECEFYDRDDRGGSDGLWIQLPQVEVDLILEISSGWPDSSPDVA
jgi:hypothetical protein